jgi:BlaI family transcriptional regulator, penicillinase repressor
MSGPSGRELQILKVLWELGESSVREVHQHLCPNGELAFNTVQTLLRIMDEKGLAKHKRKGRTFIYRATHTRDREVSRFLSQVFDGAVDQCVVSLLQTGDVSNTELDDLQNIIRDARERQEKD